MSDKNWLSYLNLSDPYERKARFLPGALTVCFLLPVSAAWGGPLLGWMTTLLSGVGLAAVFSVGISHFASAMGNRYQRILWPDWPHDSPTNQMLHPENELCSSQQRRIWYEAIKILTGLNIEKAIVAANENELKSTINDAITKLRNELWSYKSTERLQIHNTDYGFARNFTGLRIVWLTFSLISCLGSWAAYIQKVNTMLWPITSSIILIGGLIVSNKVLPYYVRDKALHYAQSFFGTVMVLYNEHVVVHEGHKDA